MGWMYTEWFCSLYLQQRNLCCSKLTYQKANKVVEKFVLEGPNWLNTLKYEIEGKFYFIHYIYSLLYPKIYNRTNDFGIQKKNDFDFSFQNWKLRKNNGPAGPKIIGHLPNSTKQILITDVLSKPKNPKDYKAREVNENEQVPINIDQQNPPPALPKMLIQKRDLRNDKTDGKKLTTVEPKMLWIIKQQNNELKKEKS